MAVEVHHNVYVIELDRAVLDEPRFAAANPRHYPEKPCVYVGSTGLSPEKRFENHKSGRKANRFVRKYGLRLLPMLYEEYNPLGYEDACEMEEELAAMLREKGYAVWQK